MALVSCPSCDTADHLIGVDVDDGKVVECGACGHRWRRDLTPTCRLCGSTDLEAVATSTLEEAGRGDQRTPSGIRTAYRCWACGARDATSSSPVAAPAGWRDEGTRPRAQRGASDHPNLDEGDDQPAASRRVESAFGVFEEGRTVGGRWRLTTLLRWSSTGSIWAATDVDGGQRVAFKLLHPGIAADGTLAALHAGSAKAAAAVAHPNRLRILDVRRRERDLLVVAEAVTGPTLAQTVAATADLTGLAGGIGGALAAMHRRGLAHLDVRPDKVLIPAGGPARLVDFGSGRVRARTPTDRYADDRMAWQAPEQVVAGTHGPAADVYSLALTLWVAAGGRLDDLGVNPPAQARYRSQHDLPPLGPTSAATPALRDAVAAGGRRRPEDRPTARAFTELLTGS